MSFIEGFTNKTVKRFGVRRKLNPRYIGLFEVLKVWSVEASWASSVQVSIATQSRKSAQCVPWVDASEIWAWSLPRHPLRLVGATGGFEFWRAFTFSREKRKSSIIELSSTWRCYGTIVRSVKQPRSWRAQCSSVFPICLRIQLEIWILNFSDKTFCRMRECSILL